MAAGLFLRVAFIPGRIRSDTWPVRDINHKSPHSADKTVSSKLPAADGRAGGLAGPGLAETMATYELVRTSGRGRKELHGKGVVSNDTCFRVQWCSRLLDSLGVAVVPAVGDKLAEPLQPRALVLLLARREDRVTSLVVAGRVGREVDVAVDAWRAAQVGVRLQRRVRVTEGDAAEEHELGGARRAVLVRLRRVFREIYACSLQSNRRRTVVMTSWRAQLMVCRM